MLRRRLSYKKAGIDYSGAVAGDVLCSDLSYITSANYSGSGKTAIAIIVSNGDGTLKCIALAETTGKQYWDSFQADISTLTNCSDSTSCIADVDGKGNTDKIIAADANSSSSTYCVGWCRSYSTTGAAAGNWHMPSAGELLSLNSNYSNIASAMATVGGTELIVSSVYTYFICSTERSAHYTWLAYSPPAGNSFDVTDISKDTLTNYRLRPFITINY